MLATRIISEASALTEAPPLKSHYETRVQLPRVPKEKMHDPIIYHELEKLGEGTVGSVSQVMDL